MLTIRRLQTGYGKVQILRGIDMIVPDGKIVAFLGGNGTGKSRHHRKVCTQNYGNDEERPSFNAVDIQ